MQECGASTGSDSIMKRVTVRSGGAGHAHSGVAKVHGVSAKKDMRLPKGASGKIVRIGR
jgi:hypothetical protein